MQRGPSKGAFTTSGRWRHRRSRGVSDIVATILLVAITVVLAAVLYILVMRYTSTPASLPGLGTSLALSTPQDAVSTSALVGACAATACNFYNMSVQSAAKGLELQDLNFEVQGANGAIFVPTGGIVAVNSVNVVVSQYGFASGWTAGATTAVTSLLTLVLYTSGVTPQSLSGDTLRVIGVSAYSGSINVHIS
ncbi:MAG: archaellin/type IV pilin N-terminal domain-containing protein [Thermoplasmata archaeon]